MPAMCHRLHFSPRLTVRALRGRRRRGCKFNTPKVGPTLKAGHGGRNELGRRGDARKCRGGEGRLEERKWEESLGETGGWEGGDLKGREVESGRGFFFGKQGTASHYPHDPFPPSSSPSHFPFLTHFPFAPSPPLPLVLHLSPDFRLSSHKHGAACCSGAGVREPLRVTAQQLRGRSRY